MKEQLLDIQRAANKIKNDTIEFIGELLKNILKGENGTIEAADVNAWSSPILQENTYYDDQTYTLDRIIVDWRVQPEDFIVEGSNSNSNLSWRLVCLDTRVLIDIAWYLLEYLDTKR